MHDSWLSTSWKEKKNVKSNIKDIYGKPEKGKMSQQDQEKGGKWWKRTFFLEE